MNRNGWIIKVDDLFPIYHAGSLGCGGIAFYTTEQMVDGISEIDVDKIVLVDGRKPMPYEDAICGACGKVIEDLNLGGVSANKPQDVSSHWKTIAVRDLMPARGIIGWLGRKLNKRWGYVWVERILAPGEKTTADEINLQIKKGLPGDP